MQLSLPELLGNLLSSLILKVALCRAPNLFALSLGVEYQGLLNASRTVKLDLLVINSFLSNSYLSSPAASVSLR